MSCALGAGEVALELHQLRDPALMAEASRRPVGSIAAAAGEHPSSPTPVSLDVGFARPQASTLTWWDGFSCLRWL